MRDLLIKLSDLLYKWVLKAPGHHEYHQVYENAQGGGYGMMYALIFVLVISIVAAAIYYFLVCSSVENANKKNYWIIVGLGALALVIAVVVGLRLITGYNKSDYFGVNLLMLSLMSLVYYALLFEVWSLVFLPMSKSTVHFFSK